MKKLVLLLVALCLVIGIGLPALAQHPVLDVAFEIVWGDIEEYDADVIVILTDDQGIALQGWDNIHLNPDPNFVWWTIQLLNVPQAAVGYKITWDPGEGLEWAPEPAIYDDIDWQNEEIFNWTFVELEE